VIAACDSRASLSSGVSAFGSGVAIIFTSVGNAGGTDVILTSVGCGAGNFFWVARRELRNQATSTRYSKQ